MILFITGFIASSSGWAPLIAWSVQGRPAWSLCGQDMCSCLPTTPIVNPTDTTEPHCPLCVTTSPDPAPQVALHDNPKRIPRTEKFDTLADATQAGCSGLFLLLILTVRPRTHHTTAARDRVAIDQDTRPGDPARDLPTPPPRA